MINFRYIFITLSVLVLFCCRSNYNTEELGLENTINKMADAYLKRLFETFPGRNYNFEDFDTQRVNIYNNSIEHLERWHQFEDSLYMALNKIDLDKEIEKGTRITYWILKEELESSIQLRVCREELWNVNHITGIHTYLINLIESQPVKTNKQRKDALKRWAKIPEIINTELFNLRIGLAEGYTMPQEIVQLVIDDLEKTLSVNEKESIFMSPSERSDNVNFKTEWKHLATGSIFPAIKKYNLFLKEEYYPNTRESVSILDNEGGENCYQAYLRKQTSAKIKALQVFETGKRNVETNMVEVKKIAKDIYNSDDIHVIIDSIKSDSSIRFNDKHEVLAHIKKLIIKTEKQSKNWFKVIPDRNLEIKPYPIGSRSFGSYEFASEDSTSYFRINLDQPTKISKASLEKLVFHEAIPGHHFQITLENTIKGRHEISENVGYNGYIEGWARYTEALAEEMNLYTTEASLILRRTWNYRGMVVDPGLHLYKWNKEKVIDYIMESGGSYNSALSLYYRIIATPGQLTSYDVGATEIFKFREIAESKLSTSFDLKEFHELILKNGSIPLTALEKEFELWLRDQK